MEITFYRKLADRVAEAVISNHHYSEPEAKRIRYGLVCIFSDLYKFILMFIIFSLFSATIEFLLAFVAVLLLRPVLGGYHAKSEIICIIVSFGTMLASIVAGKSNLLPHFVQMVLLFILPLAGILLAPVRTRKVIEKKRTYKILGALLTAVLLLLDYFFIQDQILMVSVIIIYFLSIYQLIKNKKHQRI